MQNGPRYLTEGDIHTIYTFTAANTSGIGQTPVGYTYEDLGQIGQTGDGRYFRLVVVGGTSTVKPGTLLVAPAAATNSTGLAIPTAQPSNTATGSGSAGNSALSSGSFAINVTNGATAVTTDEFKGGFLEVLQTSGTNEGPVSYLINGNTSAAGSGAITVYLAEALAQPEVLVAGTDTVNLVKSPWYLCVTSTTAGTPIGFTVQQVPNTATLNYVTWVQTRGHGLGVGDAGLTLGQTVTQSTANAGNVMVTASDSSRQIASTAATSGGAGTVSLDINIGA